MHLPPWQGGSLKAPSSATPPFTPPPPPTPLGHPPFLPLQMLNQREARAELSGEMSSTTLSAKHLHSGVCSPSFRGRHHWLALPSYCWVAFRDQERRHQAIDAHETNALLPPACFLQLFVQAPEAGCWGKGLNGMLGLHGTIGKISRVIVTAQGETEQNKNLFLFFSFSLHMYFAFLTKADLFFNCLLFFYSA